MVNIGRRTLVNPRRRLTLLSLLLCRKSHLRVVLANRAQPSFRRIRCYENRLAGQAKRDPNLSSLLPFGQKGSVFRCVHHARIWPPDCSYGNALMPQFRVLRGACRPAQVGSCDLL
jgi:hypothetical protein